VGITNKENPTNRVATVAEKIVRVVISSVESLNRTMIADTKTETVAKTLPNGARTKMRWLSH
jgi:hypothetical protein